MQEDQSNLAHLVTKVRCHWHWGRTQGFSRLIEEDELDPVMRLSNAWRKWRWRRSHGVAPGSATPVFLVGLQRSGTNMVVRGLERTPEFEVHNENDRAAFHRYQLRPLPRIADIVRSSRHGFVLFKPLCDSHRTNELLDDLGAGAPGRAIWVYRSVDGRARSALAKFGDHNLQVLTEIAGGGGEHLWQAQRISAENLALIRRFDYQSMTPASAAALFWYVRNSLFFDLGLDRRSDVALVSYDALVSDPEGAMRPLCRFLGFPWDPRLVAHVDARSSAQRPLEIDPVIRERCTELQERLDQARLAARGAAPSATG